MCFGCGWLTIVITFLIAQFMQALGIDPCMCVVYWPVGGVWLISPIWWQGDMHDGAIVESWV